jgi:hypothetical protein
MYPAPLHIMRKEQRSTAKKDTPECKIKQLDATLFSQRQQAVWARPVYISDNEGAEPGARGEQHIHPLEQACWRSRQHPLLIEGRSVRIPATRE